MFIAMNRFRVAKGSEAAFEQVEQNVKAIAWNMSAEEMAEIDKITQ